MKNISFILILAISIPNSLFAQFPIGKDVNDGINEIKLLLKKNGLTFFKQGNAKGKSYNNKTEEHDIPVELGIEIHYKEEISVWIQKNGYDNITYINYYCSTFENLNKLRKILNFSQWTYLYDINSTTKIYAFNGIKIRLVNSEKTNTLYQIIINKS